MQYTREQKAQQYIDRVRALLNENSVDPDNRQQIEEQIQSYSERLRKLSTACPEDASSTSLSSDSETEHTLQVEKLCRELSGFYFTVRTLYSRTSDSGEARHQNHYDKLTCLNNIKELMKARSVKIGLIEAEAGCQPGYMSRLLKEGTRTEPSLEFMVTAAQMLGVTLDELMRQKSTAPSEAEQYLLDFLNKLLSETKSRVLSWHRESPTMILQSHSRESLFRQHHPLEPYRTHRCNTSGFEYESRALGLPVVIEEDTFFTQLPGTDTELYILPIKGPSIGGNCWELYLAGRNTTDLICCTVETSEIITLAVRNLISAADQYCSCIHITSDARRMIDIYMNRSGR